MVEILWADSEHIALGWVPAKQYLDAAHHPPAYRTAGYWLGGGAQVVVALSLDPFNSHVTHAMAIPRCAVSRIVVLGRANKRVRRAFR